MVDVDLYAIYKLSRSAPSPELAAQLTARLNATAAGDGLTRGRIETARAVLGDDRLRANYDRMLGDPTAPPITEQTLAAMTGRPVPTPPAGDRIKSAFASTQTRILAVTAAVLVVVLVVVLAIAFSGGDDSSPTDVVAGASTTPSSGDEGTGSGTDSSSTVSAWTERLCEYPDTYLDFALDQASGKTAGLRVVDKLDLNSIQGYDVGATKTGVVPMGKGVIGVMTDHTLAPGETWDNPPNVVIPGDTGVERVDRQGVAVVEYRLTDTGFEPTGDVRLTEVNGGGFYTSSCETAERTVQPADFIGGVPSGLERDSRPRKPEDVYTVQDFTVDESGSPMAIGVSNGVLYRFEIVMQD